MNENELYDALLGIEKRLHPQTKGAIESVSQYANLVKVETWQQAWDAEARAMGAPHTVSGSIWSEAIERCLAEHGEVYIPRFEEPIYIDRPIVLSSGNRLVVHPETEMRLKVGRVGTCMLHNAGVVLGKDHLIQMCAGADQDILIEGGIWSDQNNEGRGRGGEFDQDGTMPGSMGTILLHNVERAAMRNMVFKDCSSFAAQIGNAHDFIVEAIHFDETADGIHVEGPASHGIIRNIAGKTNDDAVALNAWDWYSGSLTFGPITDILVEDVQMPPGYSWSELRLLPGTKVFASGERLDCNIERVIFRDIRGIHTFKMYDQPNIANPEGDFADPIGKMSDIFFGGIEVDGISLSDYYDKSSDAVFDICVDIDGMSIRDVRFNYIPGSNDMAPYLVSVGPKSLIWKREPSGESLSAWRPAVEGEAAKDEWVQVFNPVAKPVVRGLTVGDVWIPDADNPGKSVLAPKKLKEINFRV